LDERGLPVGYGLRPEWEVTPREVRAALAGANPPLLLDCRRDEEWAFNRVAGAMHIAMSEVEKRVDEVREALEERPEREVVVYCHHGVRSMRVTATLRALGLERVRSMAGGIDAWSLGVDGGVPRY
jgi:rhodanese-related sulfurtransferase